MVKRNILEKMSDRELLQYLRSDSRFVPQALEIAFDILKKRNHRFTAVEVDRISQLIESKRNDERDHHLKSTWDIGEDAEKGAVSFYSQTAIWVIGVLFGTLVGAILLAINLFKVSRSKGLLILLYGILYIYMLYFVYQIMQIYFDDFVNQVISVILNILGVIILQVFFWKKYLTGIIYKKRSASVPLVLCICIYLVLYVFMLLHQETVITGWIDLD